MSERYTRRDAEAAFHRLANALRKTYSDPNGDLWTWDDAQRAPKRTGGKLWTREGNENRAAVGAWCLDYAGVYGGFVVHEISNEGGGVGTPLGHLRRNARDFCDAVRFALDAMACQPSDGFGRIVTNWRAVPGGRRE